MRFLNHCWDLPPVLSWEGFWSHKWWYWKWFMLISKVVLFHLATFFSFLSIVVEGVSMILDTLVFLPATSTAEMDVVEKEQINQDGSGQTLLPHSFLLTPGFVNTWWCNSWNHLQHCACTSQCTHLVMGHFCPINIYKLHLKSPCVHLVATLWLCLLGQPQENIAYLLHWPPHKRGENKHAVPTVPWVFFQLPSLLEVFFYLPNPRFSKQCE